MKAIVTQDAHILTPNKEHQNFTTTNEILEAETKIEGRPTIVKGLRKGQPFDYKLFLTDKKQYIRLNKIKPKEVTEVTLGADAAQSPTVVTLPAAKHFFNKGDLIGVGIGAAVGFGYAKYKKLEHKKIAIYALIGGAIGFFVGKYVEKRKAIAVATSK